MRNSTTSLPLHRHSGVPASIRSLARDAPRWTGRGHLSSPQADRPVLFLVDDGVVMVSTVAPTGRVVAAALLGPTDAWTGTAGPSVRMDALRPASVALIDLAAVTAAVATDAAAAGWLADRYLRRAVAAERRTAGLVTLTVDERVRRVFRDLARAASTPLADGRTRLDVRVSQERLAWLAGTTRESANRVVRSLIEAGGISRTAGRYVLAPGFSPGSPGPS